MKIKKENSGFICGFCAQKVLALTNGGFRNHCPFCLYSKHLDIGPGDRRSDCKGLMEPVGFRHRGGKQQLLHRCQSCGVLRANKIANYTLQSDDINQLIELQLLT